MIQFLSFAVAGVQGDSFWSYGHTVYPLIALILVGLCCGTVGSLVVGSRMAFFSDALAHCAFAGVSIGFLLFTFVIERSGLAARNEFWNWVTPTMVVFGAIVGSGIALIRSRTNLASDTVIGVFFAGSIGLNAMIVKIFGRFVGRDLFNLEEFLFGHLLNIEPQNLYLLAGLVVVTFLIVGALNNYLLLDNFNSSLALSRRVPVSLCRYLFIVLLAVIVNLCLRYVGVLLITALLIVPAATAVNVSRNLRQLFWATIVLSVLVPVLGQWISWETSNLSETKLGIRIELGIPGTVVVLAVVLFFLSMILGPLWRDRGGKAARSPLPLQ